MLAGLLSKVRGADAHRARYVEMVHQEKLPPDLENALLRDFDIAERQYIDRIEALRQQLLQDSTELLIMDHGAGSPKDKRSIQEMERGVRRYKTVGEMCRLASKPPVWAEMLFKLIRQAKSKRCIEMGTCVGISGAYIGAALELNGEGKLLTLEGAESLAAVAQRNFASLGLSNVDVRIGTFSKTLAPALEAMAPVDFMFIDGHHDQDATLQYFAMARPHLSPSNILVFDDINWSEGMKAAWKSIRNETEAYSLGNVGFCVDVAKA